MQRATDSSFCCSVNWRLVLVGLVIDGQSDGHGVTLRDLSTERGEAQYMYWLPKPLASDGVAAVDINKAQLDLMRQMVRRR